MAQRDMISNIGFNDVLQNLIKSDGNKTTTTSSVDTKGAKSASFLLAFKDVDATFLDAREYDDVDVVIQESEDNINFSDIADVKHLGNKKWETKFDKIGAVSTERYLRLKFVANNLEDLATNKLQATAFFVKEMEVKPVI